MRTKEHKELLTAAKRIVIKVGTSTLTHPNGKLNLFRMESLARDISDLSNRGLEVILVSSGAISAGMGRMGIAEKPKAMPEKQALAAVGQGILLHMYEKLFGEYEQIVAQVLLTKDDIQNRERYLNARNTLFALLNYGVIPIINENDTVVVEEIKFGENDTLSALVAGLVDADLLVLLSDIEGLYTADPRIDDDAQYIDVVEEITPEIESLAGDSVSKLACGGMVTKIKAARIACGMGVPMVVANGSRGGIIREIIEGKERGTLFLPRGGHLNSRKCWIAFGSKTSGLIRLDRGAEQAIVKKGKSLLPSGIIGVEGEFSRGYVVSLYGSKGEIARGIVNYGSADIDKIKGCQSNEIMEKLGYKDDDEVIHRDNLTLCV